MAANSFGHLLKLTTFGESHGPAIGGILDHFPAGVELNLDAVQIALNRRRPGQSALTTQRDEKDRVQILSGVFEGKSTGSPIGFLIPNEDAKSKDYNHLKETFRPSHADFTYETKYGHRDYRGGGRSSARETACRVAAGALALQILPKAVKIQAFVSGVGSLELSKDYHQYNLEKRYDNDVRCPDESMADQMEQLIREVRKAGDTVGGVITCVVSGLPAGLGAPVFDKLHADLGKAMLSVNAVKGFEIGSGFAAASMRGSEHNDLFQKGGSTTTNNSGGVQGGISNGMDLFFRVGFKPVATLMKDQESIDSSGNTTVVKGKGRHDACVVPRAVPIVEAMASLVLADHYLLNRTSKI